MRQIVTGLGFDNAGGTPLPISKASRPIPRAVSLHKAM